MEMWITCNISPVQLEPVSPPHQTTQETISQQMRKQAACT